MTTERVWFESSSGPALAGLIDHPEGQVRGWGVFVHGFTLGKDHPSVARTCRQLAAKGIGMLRFDALGLGDSEGEWGEGGFSVKVADTVRAVALMAERGAPAGLLVGHSWGGSAAIAAAARIPEVTAVATINAPADPTHVQHHFSSVIDQVMAEGSAPWTVAGRTLTLTRSYVEDVRRASILPEVSALGRPLLVVHSPCDATVSIDHATELFMAARHPRSFVSLEEADHLLTKAGRAQRAAKVISAWAGPYLRQTLALSA
ncbi:alpha/beta hydrolase family protein [Nocardioides sp. Kera G14]|uniref:alpha/beta hydrolase family protein n=1 Tax=Nocardioides sp. Kera G14 TaxID=2884264 RepID=UPI001D0F7D48|nr:alpha/beta hydrolase [Nocardioides sp. Kera G14]UDY23437.1 alpha/beta hydrolase [Nocardioides sp. Kera G14]